LAIAVHKTPGLAVVTVDHIVLAAAILFALIGLLVGARGAARTQTALRRGGTHDALIDAMAWIDRNLLPYVLLRRDIHRVATQVASSGRRIEEKVDFYGQRSDHKLDEILALLRNDPRVAATAAEYHLSREVVDGLFVRLGFDPPSSPEALPGAFEALAARFASISEALAAHSGDDPDIAKLKVQALEALEAAVDLDTADRLLDAIRERQQILIAQRRVDTEKARAELLAALQAGAEICARQADAALLRLDVDTAAVRFDEGIVTLADAPISTRWNFELAAAGTLQKFGERSGNNESLVAAVSLYRRALADAAREQVPLDWAGT
jgi:hypothetical protein